VRLQQGEERIEVLILRPLHQLGQFGDVDGDAPGFISGQQAGSRPPSRLLLIVDVAQCLPVGVPDDEAGAVVFDSPMGEESGGWSSSRRIGEVP
jgi:hypothetical protein